MQCGGGSDQALSDSVYAYIQIYIPHMHVYGGRRQYKGDGYRQNTLHYGYTGYALWMLYSDACLHTAVLYSPYRQTDDTLGILLSTSAMKMWPQQILCAAVSLWLCGQALHSVVELIVLA